MKTCNLCKKLKKDQIIALEYYARRMGADEMIIDKDGTITLICEYGCICEHYQPSNYELYGHKEVWVEHEDYISKEWN